MSWPFDPPRAAITRIGEVIDTGHVPVVQHWYFDDTNGYAGPAYGLKEGAPHICGWTVDDLREVAALNVALHHIKTTADEAPAPPYDQDRPPEGEDLA